MKAFAAHSITVFLAFFAVMNPVSNAAVFVGLTADQDAAMRKKTAYRAVATAFCIILLFCVLGNAIFQLFGISLPAFRIAGGVLIALVGYHMLQGQSSRLHHPGKDPTKASSGGQSDVAISPLALPILAGPGTIATAVNYSATGNVWQVVVTVAAFTLLCAITLAAFLSGDRLIGFLGHKGMDLVTRLMGLILAVVGVQMLIEGVRGAKF